MFYYLPREQINISRKRIIEAEANLKNNPEKTKPIWDLARVTLESYFSRNLIQITSIFWLSVVVLMSGFGIIIWGISQAVKSSNVSIVAVIATSSGVITEFIGATFILVYRSTIQQAVNYSKTLERINAVGMAMQILDTIPEGAKIDDLKERTKAALVELLVRQNYEVLSHTLEESKNKNDTIKS